MNDPSERPILFVPPAELLDAQIVITGDGPSHLVMREPMGNRAMVGLPAAAAQMPRTRAQQRCYRCGWEKIGPMHKRTAASNAAEYCMKPEQERYPFWEVPEGYNIGDRKTTVRSDMMRKRWAEIMLMTT